MQENNISKLKKQIDKLEVLAKRIVIEKRFARDKAGILEKQLEAAEAVHQNTVEKINSVVTMIDKGVDNDR